MREEEECEPGCYKHIYFLHICREIINGECKRLASCVVNARDLRSYEPLMKMTILLRYNLSTVKGEEGQWQ